MTVRRTSAAHLKSVLERRKQLVCALEVYTSWAIAGKPKVVPLRNQTIRGLYKAKYMIRLIEQQINT